jgi:hypothetical protein
VGCPAKSLSTTDVGRDFGWESAILANTTIMCNKEESREDGQSFFPIKRHLVLA